MFAMKIGGVDRNTRNPEGGVIDKDASGNPNGIFEEKAIGLISLHIPPPTVAEISVKLELWPSRSGYLQNSCMFRMRTRPLRLSKQQSPEAAT
jgi:hypothetical protein